MTRFKRIISLTLAIITVVAVASISVFAIEEWESSSGCYIIEVDNNLGQKLRRTLEVNRTSLVSATGVGYNTDSSYTYRVAVNAYAYCSDCDLFANNQGYGWMGNPGQSTAYINVDGYECIEAGAEYIYYENGVYLATRYMDWDSRDYPN